MDIDPSEFFSSAEENTVKARKEWFREHQAQEASSSVQPPAQNPTYPAGINRILKYLATAAKTFSDAAVATLERSAKRETQKIGLIPPKFKGNHEDGRRFLTAFRLYINSNQTVYNDDKKILNLACRRMEGKAGTLIGPYMESAIINQSQRAAKTDFIYEVQFSISDYDRFVAKFEATWFPADPGNTAV